MIRVLSLSALLSAASVSYAAAPPAPAPVEKPAAEKSGARNPAQNPAKPAAKPGAEECCCEDRGFADLLTPEVLAYVEIRDAAKLVRTYRDAPLRKAIEAHPVFAEAMKKPETQRLIEFLAGFEKAAGMTTAEGFDALAGKGVALGLIPVPGKKDPDSVLIIRGASHAKMRSVLTALVRQIPFPLNLIPVPPAEDAAVMALPGAAYVLAGDALVVSARRDLVDEAVKRYKGAPGQSLAGQPRFAAAAKARPADAALWGFADMVGPAAAAKKERLVPERSENILAALLAGGYAELARQSPWLAVSGAFAADGVKLSLHLPATAAQLPPGHAGLLPAAAPGPVWPTQRTLMTINWTRDLGSVWANREKLVRPEELAGLAEFDTNVSAAFGKDFGQEVLPHLLPDMQIVAVRQDFSGDPSAPAIRLPAFALVLHTRNAEHAGAWIRAYKKMIGIIAYILGAQAKADVDLDRETHRGVPVWFIEILGAPEQGAGSIIKNFSPAAAAIGDRVVLSSTRPLLREFIDILQDSRPAARTLPPGVPDLTEIHDGELRKAVADNREALIAKNIAEKGQTRDQAAAEVDVFLSLLEFFGGARTWAESTDSGVKIHLEVKLRTP
jgi:hypothetical protein